MKRNRLIAGILAFAILLVGCPAFAQDSAAQQQAEVVQYSNQMLKQIVKSYAHMLADNYYYGIDDEELLFAVICSMIDEGKLDINKATESMIKTLKDEHAEFYNPQEYKEMTENVSGEFSGIGVTITQTSDGILVLSVIENSPAFKAGIMDNDYIIGVNGESVEGMTISQVRNLIVGLNGTEVKVTVRRGEKQLDLICMRETIQTKQLETRMINDKTAYMKLIQFTTDAPKEVEAYVKELQSKSVKNLIIDLRDNPGGDLQAAIDIANIFISAGRIAQLRYKDETENTFINSKNYNAPRFKMVVLVNENSASASEFLATAFKSRGAGKIIGKKTFGKGSMQVLTKLVTGAGMKYTIGEFYSYKGERVHTVGVTPDIEVENTYVPVDQENFVKVDYDRILEGAIGGDMTLALEQRLEALGYLEEADEVFDEKTSAAVSRLQALLGYEINGIPGFNEYLYLNDYNYDFDVMVDDQLQAAIDYFN